MIDKLSEMMRYTTKDTQQDFVLLEDEINYISNYIELQKLRLDRSVKLEYGCPDDVPALRIAPMLVIPFVENAFKHGVNSEQKSRIRIEIKISNTEFQLSVVKNGVTNTARFELSDDEDLKLTLLTPFCRLGSISRLLYAVVLC